MHLCSFKYMEIIWNGSIDQMQAKFIGVKFLRAHSRFKKRKKNLSSSIYFFYKTSRLELLLVYRVQKVSGKFCWKVKGALLAVLIHSLVTATAKTGYIPSETKIEHDLRLSEHDFLVRSSGNFREQRNIWKGSPVFPDRMFQTEIHVPLLQAVFDTIDVYRTTLYSWLFSENGTHLYKW